VAKTQAGETRKRRQRGSINADDIVAAAFEVARGASIDQMSMPNLAEHLDVAVTSIYWHFRKKDELLNAMTDVAVQKQTSLTPAILDSDTWQQSLRRHFTFTRDLHRQDEVLSDLLLMRTSTYSAQATLRTMQVLETLVAKLVDSGFSPDDAIMSLNTISVYIRGMIIHERILIRSGAPTLDGRQVRMTDWSSMPVLQQVVDHRPLAGTTDDDFEFSLVRIFAGIEAMLEQRQGVRALTLPAAGPARIRASASAAGDGRRRRAPRTPG
jgi:AcrR family transcriptional regulator